MIVQCEFGINIFTTMQRLGQSHGMINNCERRSLKYLLRI